MIQPRTFQSAKPAELLKSSQSDMNFAIKAALLEDRPQKLKVPEAILTWEQFSQANNK